MRRAADVPGRVHTFAAGLRFDTEVEYLAERVGPALRTPARSQIQFGANLCAHQRAAVRRGAGATLPHAMALGSSSNGAPCIGHAWRHQ